VADVAWTVGAVFLVVWALLELVRGVNYFRRALGLVVLLISIGGLFKI
jgi:hypothetical protein